jgi:hypothetical protein
MKKIKTALWLKPDHVAGLKMIQKKIGVPISESVRRAIDEYLVKWKRENK